MSFEAEGPEDYESASDLEDVAIPPVDESAEVRHEVCLCPAIFKEKFKIRSHPTFLRLQRCWEAPITLRNETGRFFLKMPRGEK